MMTMTITTTMAMILMRMSTVSSPVLIFIVCFIILIFVVLFVCFSFAMIFLILFIFFFCLLFLSFIFFIFFTLHLQSSLFSASSLLLRVHLFSSYSHYLLHFLMRWSGWWVISLADLSLLFFPFALVFVHPPCTQVSARKAESPAMNSPSVWHPSLHAYHGWCLETKLLVSMAFLFTGRLNTAFLSFWISSRPLHLLNFWDLVWNNM